MSKSIPREFIDKLIEMSDIVGIIGTYVDLRQLLDNTEANVLFMMATM